MDNLINRQRGIGDTNKMKILFFINTPAQALTWIPIIRELKSKGHEIRILARDYGSAPEILKSNGLDYISYKPISHKYLRIFELLVHLQKGYDQSRKYGINMVIGWGVDAALTAAIIGKSSIIFTDNDRTHLQDKMTNLFAGAVITPDCSLANFGKKQIRIGGYKELVYLNPNNFVPDPSIYGELKINREEKFIILRFNVWDAVHDIGLHGLSSSDKFKLVTELSKYAHVFISPEGALNKELEGYRLPISYSRIHHALYYAQLLVTDTQTMATEAAILGTAAIRCNNVTGIGVFQELEKKYDLIYSYNDFKQTIDKAIELLKLPDLKEQWAKKRQILLNDKIDVKQFMVNFIDNYPESLIEYQRKRGLF